MAVEQKTRLLPIGEMLSAVDRRDGDWLSKQSEDAQKEFSAPVFQRFLTCVRGDPTGAYMLQAINQTVNVHLWSIWDHPSLVFRLAASCGLNKRLQRDMFFSGSSKRKSKKNIAVDLMTSLHPCANAEEIDMLLSLETVKSFDDLIDQTGCSKKDATALRKAFQSLGSSSPKK